MGETRARDSVSSDREKERRRDSNCVQREQLTAVTSSYRYVSSVCSLLLALEASPRRMPLFICRELNACLLILGNNKKSSCISEGVSRVSVSPSRYNSCLLVSQLRRCSLRKFV